MSKLIEPYPYGYPKVVDEEPTTKLNTQALYEFHVRKAEHAKQRCDDIIAYHLDRAHWTISLGLSQLRYDAETLAERNTANDLIFAKWSGKYRFHEARAMYVGQRVLMAQQTAIIKLLQNQAIQDKIQRSGGPK